MSVLALYFSHALRGPALLVAPLGGLIVADDEPRDIHDIPKLPLDYLGFDLGMVLPELDVLIQQRGTPVRVVPHVICPCIQSSRQGGTGEAVPDCPSCNGSGFAFTGDGVKMLAVVQGVGSRDTHDATGIVGTGRITVTFTSDVTVAEGDLLHLYKTIIPMRHSRKYNEALRGFPVPFDVKDVRTLVTTDPSDLKLINLSRGRDFTVDVDKNRLYFPDGSRVKDGMNVSGVFMVSPYYVIDSFTAAFRGQLTSSYSSDGSQQWAKMPQSATAVRADLMFSRFHPEDINVNRSL